MSDFESLGLKGGIWQGVIARAEPPGRLSLVHLGERIAEVLATPEGARARRRFSPARGSLAS